MRTYRGLIPASAFSAMLILGYSSSAAAGQQDSQGAPVQTASGQGGIRKYTIPKHHAGQPPESSSESTGTLDVPPPSTETPATSAAEQAPPARNAPPAVEQHPEGQPPSEGGGEHPVTQQTTATSTKTGDDQTGTGKLLSDKVLEGKMGPERFQRLQQQIDGLKQLVPQVPGADDGRGAPSSSIWFDGAAPRVGNDEGLQPGGTNFFHGASNAGAAVPVPVPVTTGTARRATLQDSQDTIKQLGSIPGGVVLEGEAGGLGKVDNVDYDARYNALILDDRSVYFMRIPPSAVVTLCRAIAEDEAGTIGVSLGRTQLVYGKLPEDSGVVWDLKLADHFLGSIVFAWNDGWTNGYRFAGGYTPEPNRGPDFNVAIFFMFNDFQFEVRKQELQPMHEGFLARLFPLSNSEASNGGLKPDDAAISNGQMSEQYLKNAQHLAENISYYRREKIVDRMFAYGEVAAILRTLNKQGFDLEALARHIPAQE